MYYDQPLVEIKTEISLTHRTMNAAELKSSDISIKGQKEIVIAIVCAAATVTAAGDHHHQHYHRVRDHITDAVAALQLNMCCFCATVFFFTIFFNYFK